MNNLLLLFLILVSNFMISQNSVQYSTYIPLNYFSADTNYYPEGNIQEIKYFHKQGWLITKLSFHENGNLRSCLNFNQFGDFHSAIIYWYNNGQIETIAHYIDGQKFGSSNFGWSKDGKIEYQTDCKSDTCETIWRYASGNVQKLTKSKGIKLFYVEEWCDNGQLILQDSVLKFQSNYIEFFCNGKTHIKAQKNEKRALVGPYKQWFENGQLQSEGNYLYHSWFYSKKTGQWLYYNTKGLIVLKEEYENGELIRQESLNPTEKSEHDK